MSREEITSTVHIQLKFLTIFPTFCVTCKYLKKTISNDGPGSQTESLD
jgi:hypothetical protein